MTPRTDHYAAATGEMLNALELAAVHDIPAQDQHYQALSLASIHALLAIADALNAKPCDDCAKRDAYAANEARQREAGGRSIRDLVARSSLGTPEVEAARAEVDPEAVRRVLARVADPEPDPLALDEAECSRCGEIYPGTAEATMEHHRACTGETPENPMGDPLDEDDHRDRLDGNGGRWTHRAHLWCMESCACYEGSWKLDELDYRFGPLTFAPEPPPDAAGDDLTAPEGESGAEEGGEGGDAQVAILCPECGHDIDRHAYDDDRAVDLCGECPDTERCPTPLPSQVARALIEQAVEQAGGRRG